METLNVGDVVYRVCNDPDTEQYTIIETAVDKVNEDSALLSAGFTITRSTLVDDEYGNEGIKWHRTMLGAVEAFAEHLRDTPAMATNSWPDY